VFEYLAGVALFKLWEFSSTNLDDSHFQRILERIGPFPSSFLEACHRRADLFGEQGGLSRLNSSARWKFLFSGSLLRVQDLFPSAIEEFLHPYKIMDEKDIPSAADLTRRCLTIDSRQRRAAMDSLDDEWLKNV
jgi:serine/threonine-protein kinase SRPK3